MEKTVTSGQIAAIVVVVIFAVYATINCQAFTLRPTEDLQLAQLFFSLLFISLIVERALEVFFTTFRAPGAEKRQATVLQERAAANFTAGAIAPADGPVGIAEKDLYNYKKQTRSWALIVGLLAGVAIAACGFRILEAIVVIEKSQLQLPQVYIYRGLDILFTGGVIAGGSDGIHKLAEVYRTTTEKGAAG